MKAKRDAAVKVCASLVTFLDVPSYSLSSTLLLVPSSPSRISPPPPLLRQRLNGIYGTNLDRSGVTSISGFATFNGVLHGYSTASIQSCTWLIWCFALGSASLSSPHPINRPLPSTVVPSCFWNRPQVLAACL